MIQPRHRAAVHYLTVSALAISAALAATTAPVQAQQSTVRQQAAADVEEITVTARKRQESIINVPVVETAIPKAKLEAMQVIGFSDLTKTVPGVVFTHSSGLNGGQLTLRGVGNLGGNFGIDSSVPINLDGMSIGTGLTLQSGLFDLQQIEVLKGPQALFFGKGSPGGVISVRSADPTDKFELMARASYEFEARTPREEFTISGPVTDTLKLRLASMYSTSEGYFNYVGVPVTAFGALKQPSSRGPSDKQYILRGTALWNPNDQFDARLKLNLVHDRSDQSNTLQLSACPDGTGAPSGIPFIGVTDACKLDRNVNIVAMNPANFPGIANHGVEFINTDQKYGTLELNYHPAQDLTLTSVTGYYYLRAETLLNAGANTGAATPFSVPQPNFHRDDLTEELRLNSDFNKPLNFTVGALYEDGQFYDDSQLGGNSAYRLPAILSWIKNTINVRAYSAFGQLRYKFTPELELAGGLRWTSETRNEIPINGLTNAPVILANTHLHSSNVAPEVTLTYRPTDDMTLFAAYKQAYKSGSFSLGSLPATGSNNSFGDEKAQGGEIGIKSRWLDRQLAVNAAGYYYHYSGLQVGQSISLPSGQIVNQIINAGGARSYGIDLDAAYSPQSIDGLTLNGAALWNSARFTALNAPCYGGQTIANGCDQSLNPVTGLYTQQNLAGTQLIRAPVWQFNVGFDYAMPVGADYKLTLSNTNAYTSRYPGVLDKNYPNNANYQSGFVKVDLSLALASPDDRWEVALVGKNITDKIIAGYYAQSNTQNGLILGGQITGGTGVGPAGVDELNAYSQTGREIWLRVTLRPFN